MALATSSSSPDRPSSMRFRAAAWLAALALVVILAQSLVMVWLLDSKEEEFIERQLSAQIEHSMEIWRKSPEAVFQNAPGMWLYRQGKLPGQHDTPPPLFAGLAVGNHEVYLGSKEYHVAVREDEQARYFLAYDVEEHESRLGAMVLLTIVSSVLLALFVLWAGYAIAGRLTQRLEQLELRVASDYEGPLVEPGMEREVLAVAVALEHSRERQQAMLARERAFVANLSHELRTPLTGIRTDAELLAALPDMPEAAVRRGNRIINSVDRINGLASSLLWLARETSPAPLEPVCLRPAIEAVWHSLVMKTPESLQLQLDIPEKSTVMADPRLFDLVLRNVLENAQRYSEAGEILCTLKATVLSVRDSGPGFAETDLERVFDRFFVGERGEHGLGLALVRHVCAASGWKVRARNAVRGGEILIDFGEVSDGRQPGALDA